MFHHQPTHSFAGLLSQELEPASDGHPRWTSFEFAAAWLNSTGAQLIADSAARFLTNGGMIRATIGLDFSSTSYEGLQVMLTLESRGLDITTHVFFDENRATTFHPKVYLFSNSTSSLLYVGSPNMTGAGLRTNVEAALAINARNEDAVITSARHALAAWRDDLGDSRVKRLTRPLLTELLRRAYVRTEAQLRRQRATHTSPARTREARLFGRSRSARNSRARPGRPSHTSPALSAMAHRGHELLMRVRPRRNGTQLQISMHIHKSPFMSEATEVVSMADGTRRPIGYDFTSRAGRRAPNLARFEAPELAGKSNPVARFRWATASDKTAEPRPSLYYEIFDAEDGGTGRDIYTQLEGGIATPPTTNLTQLNVGTTVISKPDRSIAQWYQLSVATP